MELWTIQTEPAWRSLQERGYLRATRAHADRDLLPAYDWMAAQMKERIGPPRSSKSSVPLWAWQQYDGIERRRPDLRRAWHLPRGTHGVRVGFEIPDDQVLLSDFQSWHYVLNYSYLATSESDAEAFDARFPEFLCCSWSNPSDDPCVRSLVEESWQRIFDLDWYDPYVTAVKAEKSIQATFWQLDWDQVTSVDPFVAR
ncbi:hypothetical protein C5Y93_02375 [Blastopirellula marina]|uniref:DUF3841 domain-containing protein n=2 Tax=Blastopirellula marina TaxID=124 RepID=A0A2S8GV40_9BACT|nr:hypothetical protein C5Y93_02375 [Blastopirellula marina]